MNPLNQEVREVNVRNKALDIFPVAAKNQLEKYATDFLQAAGIAQIVEVQYTALTYDKFHEGEKLETGAIVNFSAVTRQFRAGLKVFTRAAGDENLIYRLPIEIDKHSAANVRGLAESVAIWLIKRANGENLTAGDIKTGRAGDVNRCTTSKKSAAEKVIIPENAEDKINRALLERRKALESGDMEKARELSALVRKLREAV